MNVAAPNPARWVDLRGLGVSFGDMTALEGVDLSIGEHEFVSLLGPSGCGKSTLLRVIAGLVVPTAGHAEVQRERSAREVGFVFQEPTLMPWARVAQNVELPLRLAGEGGVAARARVDAALDMVGLSEFRDAYPRELSGGMRMRVSIARALVTRPRLLLMDEPFAALDEITRLKLADDLLRLWAEHRWTVVFVTHSVYESVYLSTRVAVMSARPGRIVADLAIGEPFPRDAEFRLTPAYAAHCREVSAALARGAAHG